MKLKELFEMQKKLDTHIVEEKGLEGLNLLPQKILALQVELGELANEWRGFKFWSNNQKPRTEVKCHACEGLGEFHIQEFSGVHHSDDRTEICIYCNGTGIERKPLLEEYVDCLHFLLSIGIDIQMDDISITSYNYFLAETIVEAFTSIISNIELLKIKNYRKPAYDLCFKHFIKLGEMLNFTWEEIVQAYKEKNKTNHDRQENGY